MFNKENSQTERENLFKEVQSKRIKRQRWIGFGFEMVTIILAIISIAFSILGPGFSKFGLNVILYGLPLIFVILAIFRVRQIILEGRNENRYKYYFWSSEISKSLLTSLKRTHFAKTTAILQTTYSHMPDWHPTNICDNVLVYDIHEHLRRICIGLKELIVNLAPDEFNDDMVTVDIAFEYPSDAMLGPNGSTNRCSIEEEQESLLRQNTEKKQDEGEDKPGWKIITSGDHTSNRVFLHNYLVDYGSFYSYLAGQGYKFENDKATLEKNNHYIWTSKDREYNRIGSIVGVVIELRNDDPEVAFVRAYLTISTYGRRLVEETDELDIESFQRIFKETVINYYKTIIESELAQMFIRHGIREGFIDRQTGQLYLKSTCSKSHQDLVGQY